MGSVLLVLGGLLILSELSSYITSWPSVYDLMPVINWSDEPYVKIIAENGTDYYSYIPLVVGIIFVSIGVVIKRSKL